MKQSSASVSSVLRQKLLFPSEVGQTFTFALQSAQMKNGTFRLVDVRSKVILHFLCHLMVIFLCVSSRANNQGSDDEFQEVLA